MKAFEPASTPPIGQPSPFDRSSQTVSTWRVIVLRRNAGADHGIEQPRAVHVHDEPVLLRGRRHVLDLLDVQMAPPPRFTVCSMTTTLEIGLWRPSPVRIAASTSRAREDALVARNPVRLGTGQHGRAATLRGEHMRLGRADDLVARPAVHQHRNLVAHGAGGQEHRRLLAEQIGDPLLQPVGGRILAALLVADLGLGHCLAHAGRRLGLGVAVEVDQAVLRGGTRHAASPWVDAGQAPGQPIFAQ